MRIESQKEKEKTTSECQRMSERGTTAQCLLIKMKHLTANIVSCAIISPIIMFIISNTNRSQWEKKHTHTPSLSPSVSHLNTNMCTFSNVPFLQVDRVNCILWIFIYSTRNCYGELIFISTPPAINCTNQFPMFSNCQHAKSATWKLKRNSVHVPFSNNDGCRATTKCIKIHRFNWLISFTKPQLPIF